MCLTSVWTRRGVSHILERTVELMCACVAVVQRSPFRPRVGGNNREVAVLPFLPSYNKPLQVLRLFEVRPDLGQMVAHREGVMRALVGPLKHELRSEG